MTLLLIVSLVLAAAPAGFAYQADEPAASAPVRAALQIQTLSDKHVFALHIRISSLSGN
jgi:hypothetical protein